MGDLYLDIPRKPFGVTASAHEGNSLGNPIVVQHCIADTQNWLLNLIADARTDFEVVRADDDGAGIYPQDNQQSIMDSYMTRYYIEQILSAVIGEDVYLDLGNRKNGDSRLAVRFCSDGHVVCPSFSSLSTGQIVLFELFATIMRYADWNQGSLRVNPELIEGIVVIDEIDLHLHTSLQRTALPKLIEMFPRVQFIVTTHSPLVLLGMIDRFGEDGVAFLELPEGDFVDVDAFAEFQKAYEYYAQTKLHQQELNRAVASAAGGPLVITEGETDWMHFKAAKMALRKVPELQGLFDAEYGFLEYDAGSKINNTMLCKACKGMSLVQQKRPIIFIADSDDKTTNNELAAPDGELVKSHGNGVYSFVLPKPEFREVVPGICIELLYRDEVLKAEIPCKDGKTRRLFLSGEFDGAGRLGSDLLWPEASRHKGCGDFRIVDGGNERVLDLACDGEEFNHAVTKKQFASYILEHAEEFTPSTFDAFIPVLERIEVAIEDFNVEGCGLLD